MSWICQQCSEWCVLLLLLRRFFLILTAHGMYPVKFTTKGYAYNKANLRNKQKRVFLMVGKWIRKTQNSVNATDKAGKNPMTFCIFPLPTYVSNVMLYHILIFHAPQITPLCCILALHSWSDMFWYDSVQLCWRKSLSYRYRFEI